MLGMTRAVALDLAGDGILVNCLCPGYTETDMLKNLSEEGRSELIAKVPLKRFCQVGELANAALFLLSDQNSYTTGQTLTVDGGVVLQ